MRIYIAAFLFLHAGVALCADVGTASFLAKTNAGFEVKGEKAKVSSSDLKKSTNVNGTFEVLLKDFKTGMDLRDEHLCKALECDKYPKAVYKLSAPIEIKDGEASVSGDLTLHGVTKPFSGKAKVTGTEFKFAGDLKLADFGIKAPDYKLVKIEDLIKIEVSIKI